MLEEIALGHTKPSLVYILPLLRIPLRTLVELLCTPLLPVHHVEKRFSHRIDEEPSLYLLLLRKVAGLYQSLLLEKRSLSNLLRKSEYIPKPQAELCTSI